MMLQGILGAQALYSGKFELYNESSTLTNNEKRIITDSSFLIMPVVTIREQSGKK